jgi:hypothetical protein
MGWSHLSWELLSETRHWRKDRRNGIGDGKTRKNTYSATG